MADAPQEQERPPRRHSRHRKRGGTQQAAPGAATTAEDANNDSSSANNGQKTTTLTGNSRRSYNPQNTQRGHKRGRGGRGGGQSTAGESNLSRPPRKVQHQNAAQQQQQQLPRVIATLESKAPALGAGLMQDTSVTQGRGGTTASQKSDKKGKNKTSRPPKKPQQGTAQNNPAASGQQTQPTTTEARVSAQSAHMMQNTAAAPERGAGSQKANKNSSRPTRGSRHGTRQHNDASRQRQPANVTETTVSAPATARMQYNASASEATSTTSSKPPQNTLEPLDMAPGQRCDKDIMLVPWKLVCSYPNLYVPEDDRTQIKAYFSSKLQDNRAWDFFFIIQPGTSSRHSVLLVPLSQFQSFFDEVVEDLGPYRGLSQIREHKLFDTTKAPSEWPQPRFLARVTTAQALKAAITQIRQFPPDDYDDLSIEAYKNFKVKMEHLSTAAKGTFERNSVDLRMARLEKQKSHGRVTKRVQRYLGLRPSNRHTEDSEKASPEPNWLPDHLAPYRPKDTVRFVCIDVEAFERNTKLLTEFGFAVLDTEDIAGLAPGVNGTNWMSKIQTYHFRINEFTHLLNKRFVKGCPGSFDFGRSAFAWLKDMAKIAGSIIGDDTTRDKRPVILVGHDIMGDLKYLRQVKFNVWNAPYVVDEIDTQSMFRRFEKSPDVRSLVTTCEAMDIQTKNLHNAGNDAYYTLAAMIAMAVKQKAQPPRQGLKNWEIVEEGEWSDGELDDGGSAQRSAEPFEKGANPSEVNGQYRSPW